MRCTSRGFIRFTCAIIAAGGLIPAAEKPIERAIAALTAEAQKALDEGALAQEEPDFAARFDETIPEEEIQRALLRPQHRDAFIDAYIRWQLLSFDVEFPELDDRAFLQFMDDTPRLLENPKADLRVLADFERAEQTGPFPPAEIAKLRQFVEQLNERAMVVEHLNSAAIGFRDAIAEKLEDKGVRPRLWLIERLAAHITAGWPVRDIKGDLTRNFTNSTTDESFTDDDRRAVLIELARLVGPGRDYLGDVTYFANGTIKVSIHSSKVTQANVDNWRERLYGVDD